MTERQTLRRRLAVSSISRWLGACLIGTTYLLLMLPSPTEAQTPNWREFKKSWPKLWVRSRPCKVYRVIDGDTVHVKCQGKKEKLRLVGIDTPETKHPFKPVEYFGPEASARAKAMLPKGSLVWLGFGKRPRRGQAPRGKYGRMLAYIFMPNKQMFNARMVREGYALAMRRYPHVYMSRFIALENQAKQGRQGMWADMAKARAMMAGDKRYRQHRKRCKRKEGRRYQWVIGNRARRLYFTRRHRAYFRTNPTTRVLFCSTSEARSKGYRAAPRRFYPRRSVLPAVDPKHTQVGQVGSVSDSSDSSDSSDQTGRRLRGTIVIADKKSGTYRVYRRGSYRIFSSARAAKQAGFKKQRRRRSRKRRKSRRKRRRRGRRSKYARTPPDCGGKTPVVGNRRSKRYRTPEMSSYKRATKSKNAVYFCTAKEARDAGFVRSKR